MSDLALGIDIGGTFTDIVLYDDATAKHLIVKQSTTPQEPSEGVAIGVDRLLRENDVRPELITRVVHATTLFTNALIERKGAPTAFLTTAGFEDTLEIGLERKYDLYDLFIRKPEPLVSRRHCIGLSERVAADGEVLVELVPGELVEKLEPLIEQGITSVGICLLNSYVNPVNEQRAVQAIRERFPQVYVTASHEFNREIGEYRRAATTVANAYVQVLAEQYLQRMKRRLEGLGIGAPLYLMLSSGGLTGTEEAQRFPINLLESGPAAGALAGSFFGALDAEETILAFDMGGTTAKAVTIDDGEPAIAYEFEAAREKRFAEGSGIPLKITTVELIEIGAGGGSEARMDELGLLKVGPESAGSEPGPVSYGRGGTVPTVTDADLILGYLNPDYFLGGRMSIDLEGARRAMSELAGTSGLDMEALAWGIHDVVNERMAGAARVHIAEKGRDPRSYTLLATGGAGPVHAYYVAKKLGVPRLICPPSAGVGSAIGLLMAPARVDYVKTFGAPLDGLDWHELETSYDDLISEGKEAVARTGALLDELEVYRRADMRFRGQGFDVVVDLPPGPYTSADHDSIADAFMRTYNRLYSRVPEDVRVELVNLRVEVQAPITRNKIDFAAGDRRAGDALKGRRPVYFPEPGEYVDTQVLDRANLIPDHDYEGPAIVEEPESTLVIGPGATFRARPAGHIVVSMPAAGRAEPAGSVSEEVNRG